MEKEKTSKTVKFIGGLVFILAFLGCLYGIAWKSGALYQKALIHTENYSLHITTPSGSQWNAYEEAGQLFIIHSDKTTREELIQAERTEQTFNVRTYEPGELTGTVLSYVHWYPEGEVEDSAEIAGMKFDVARVADGNRNLRIFLNEDRTLEVFCWWTNSKEEIKADNKTLKSIVEAMSK